MSAAEIKKPFLKVDAAVSKWTRKWGTQTGLLLLAAMTVTAVFLGLKIGAVRLPSPWAYNVGADVLGVTVCALLYYGCLKERQSADNSVSLFMALLLCDACVMFLDIVSWLVDGVPALRVLYVVEYTALLTILQLESYQFWRYIRAYLALDGKLAQRCDLVMRALLIPALLVCLSNLFAPTCFYVDAQGAYYETDGYILAFAYILALAVCSTLCLLRAKAPVRNKIIIALFYIVPLIYASAYASSTDATLPDAPLLVIILMYVVLVAERSKALASTSAELNMATRIQSNMLPNLFPAFPKYQEFDVYATMDPAREVGGDFYDFFLIDSDRLALVMADVSGKGVPAALFMMTARTILKTKAQSNPSLTPKELLEEANAALTENNEEDMFVTVWFGILQISTGELTYADAGHEKLLLYQNGAWKFLPKAGGVALAMWEPEDLECMAEPYQFRNQTIRLAPGDAIFQYTDGVTEATDANSELFGDDRLLEAMNSAPTVRPEELLPHIRKKIDEFVQEAPQFDDITMLGLQYKGQKTADAQGGK